MLHFYLDFTEFVLMKQRLMTNRAMTDHDGSGSALAGATGWGFRGLSCRKSATMGPVKNAGKNVPAHQKIVIFEKILKVVGRNLRPWTHSVKHYPSYGINSVLGHGPCQINVSIDTS